MLDHRSTIDKLSRTSVLLISTTLFTIGAYPGTNLSVTKPDLPLPQTTYEMRCRGGGLGFTTTSGRSLPTGDQMMNVTLNFNAAAKPASNSKDLEPGQCSWVDRTIGQNEPKQIRLELVANGQLKQVLHGSAVSNSATQAEITPDASNVPAYLSSSAHYWIFWVYNSNAGYLQATGSKYYKPPILLNPVGPVPITKLKIKPPPKP